MQAPNSMPSRPPVTTWLTGPKPRLAEQAADLIEPEPGAGKAAGEQIEAAAHQPPAEQGDEDAGAAAGQGRERHATPERWLPAPRPASQAPSPTAPPSSAPSAAPVMSPGD